MADNKMLKKAMDYISGSGNHLKIRELSRKLGIKQNDYPEFRRIIKEAAAEGKLVKGRGGKLSIPAKDDYLIGKLFISRAGHGFVITESESEDIFVSQRDLGGAIHGEKVELVLKPFTRGRSREGIIVRVLEREKGRVVGKIAMSRIGMTLKPTDPRLPDKIEIDNPKNLAIKKNMVVSARFYPWKEREQTGTARFRYRFPAFR